MAATLTKRRTAFATWSRRAGLFSVKLAILGVLLHRFAGLPTPVMLNMLKAAMACAGLALALGFFAILRIWRDGGNGVTAAATGSLIALALLAWPAAYLPTFLKLPPINDVSTDLAAPPGFQEIAKWRQEGTNPIAYPGVTFASQQSEHYPDLKPLVVSRSAGEAFDLAREIIRRRGWMIVAVRPPAATDGSVGEIEATEQTTVMGYLDDIVVRLKADRDRTRIDVRSASRYGTSDLGRNAERVRSLLKEFYARIDLGVALEKDDSFDRRRRIRRKRPPAEDQAQIQTPPPAPAPPDARRVRGQKVEPRQSDENRARDKRRQ